MTSRLVVLASGHGSNLQAVLDACAAQRIPARVVAVGTNRLDAFALRRAEQSGVATFTVAPIAGEDRRSCDERLAVEVTRYEPDWVVLAGWMRILTMPFLGRFPNRVVNLHPALPGEFPGAHAIEQAFHAARGGLITRTGVMIHLVPDEGVDDGPVIATVEVPIGSTDTLETLEHRIHLAEQELLVSTLARLCAGPSAPVPADQIDLKELSR